MDGAPFVIPRLGALVRHAAPRVVEGMIAPVTVFLLALHFFNVAGAVIAGAGFAYAAIAGRLVTGRRVPGILLLGALTITARSVLALATGSTFLYFLQPALGTALVAVAFFVSAVTSRPLAGRLARDFCPIPDDVASAAPMRRFFVQITLLWAVTELTIAVLGSWLLLSQSVGVFVVTRTVSSLTITGLAIALSVLWFQRTMGEHVAFAPRHASPA
ncbi:MAG TPA: VC0807 family protein [Acidimicrobiia bacterium]|nr:VC0807 family protein [Acidimicrobiia bacterium]